MRLATDNITNGSLKKSSGVSTGSDPPGKTSTAYREDMGRLSEDLLVIVSVTCRWCLLYCLYEYTKARLEGNKWVEDSLEDDEIKHTETETCKKED